MIPRFNSFTKNPYSEIDEKVKTLVDTMNETGVITTIASCQGHFGGILRRPPYVYFKAPVDVAASIEQKLRETSMFDDNKLKAPWLVKGLFDDNYRLSFLLYSPKYEQESTSLFEDAWCFLLNRKDIDVDLKTLATIVKDAVLLNSGDKYKPHIPDSSEDNNTSN